MEKTIGLTLTAAAIVLSTGAFAQTDVKWPTKPVQVIVPAGAGGDTDFNARQMARYFEKLAGKPMVITNVNGGSGTIGMSQVENAAPDGNTILFAHTGMLIVNEVSGMINYKFDTKLDIACIPAIDKSMVLIGSKKSGLKTVQDVVTKAKAAPNTVIYGTEMGGFSHLQGLIFQKKAGIELKFVDVGSASDKVTSCSAAASIWRQRRPGSGLRQDRRHVHDRPVQQGTEPAARRHQDLRATRHAVRDGKAVHHRFPERHQPRHHQEDV